jgi:hypothetical protein
MSQPIAEKERLVTACTTADDCVSEKPHANLVVTAALLMARFKLSQVREEGGQTRSNGEQAG